MRRIPGAAGPPASFTPEPLWRPISDPMSWPPLETAAVRELPGPNPQVVPAVSSHGTAPGAPSPSVAAEGDRGGDRDYPALECAESLDLRGEAVQPFLHQAEYVILGARAPRRNGPTEEHTEAARRSHIRALRIRLDQVRRLGEPPWSADRFQIVGALRFALGGEGPSAETFAIVGRDFRVPASPEDTVTWYLDSPGSVSVPSAAREKALVLLRHYEAERRILLSRIVNRILELSSTRSPEQGLVGYAITGHQLFLVREGASRDAEQALRAAGQIEHRIIEEARRRVR